MRHGTHFHMVAKIKLLWIELLCCQLWDMAKEKDTTIDRKAEALTLYLTGQHEQQWICKVLSISVNTFTRWKREGSWDARLSARRTSKERMAEICEKQILLMYEKSEEEGRVLNSKEINSMWQLTNMLRKAEETGTTTAIVNVLTEFTAFVGKRYPDMVKQITAIADEYIQLQFAKEA